MLSALYSDMWKKFCIDAHLHSLPLITAENFFLNSVCYLYEVVRTHFSADFLDFSQFWPQFCENCGANYRQKWELSSLTDIGNRVQIDS